MYHALILPVCFFSSLKQAVKTTCGTTGLSLVGFGWKALALGIVYRRGKDTSFFSFYEKKKKLQQFSLAWEIWICSLVKADRGKGQGLGEKEILRQRIRSDPPSPKIPSSPGWKDSKDLCYEKPSLSVWGL
jgi:hypothetical protein